MLLDDDDGDQWVGVYVLRAGDSGWLALDQVQLGIAPTAARFGKLIKPGPALLVGDAGGRVFVLDYKADEPYAIDEIVLDPPVDGPVKILHSGVVGATDETASLVIHDGTSLWRSDPIDLTGTTGNSVLSTGAFFDAAFWPLSTNDPSNFVAARSEDEVEWHLEASGGSTPSPTAIAARFGHLVNSMCGTHLVVSDDDKLWVGWIACDGSGSATESLVGSDIPQVKAMVAADLGGTTKHDVVLIGTDASGMVYAQGLIDIDYNVATEVPYFEAATTTVATPLAAGPPEAYFLVAADVEADGSALVYAIEPSGAGFCGQLDGTQVALCPPGWQLRGP